MKVNYNYKDSKKKKATQKEKKNNLTILFSAESMTA